MENERKILILQILIVIELLPLFATFLNMLTIILDGYDLGGSLFGISTIIFGITLISIFVELIFIKRIKERM